MSYTYRAGGTRILFGSIPRYICHILERFRWRWHFGSGEEGDGRYYAGGRWMLGAFFADYTVLDAMPSFGGFLCPFGWKGKLVLCGWELMRLDYDTFWSAPAIMWRCALSLASQSPSSRSRTICEQHELEDLKNISLNVFV